jgi:AcrR family transcriptional regulator
MEAVLMTEAALPRPDSRRLVLDQAARLFRERGFAETSLRDIAGACGMKTASLYYHFPSKEDIVAEVLNTGIANVAAEVQRRIAALGPDAPPADLLRAGISGHLHALLELDDFTGANIRIFGHVPPRVRAATMAQREQYEQMWRDLLADAAARGAIRPGTDLRLLRLLLLGAMNWTVEWHKPRRNEADSVEAIARSLVDLALHGVFEAAPAPSARPRGAVARRG